jgi:hypothetical protein
MSTSRETSQKSMDSRTRNEDRIEHSYPSSSSPSSQSLTHTDSTAYSDIPTSSRAEPGHSEPKRQEGAEGSRQIGDGGLRGGGISKKTTETMRSPPTKALSSPHDQPSNKPLEASDASSLPPTLLDPPAKKSRDMPASSTDRTTRTEGMCICRFSLSLMCSFARKSQIAACRFELQNPLSQPQTPPRDMASTFVTRRRRLPVLLQPVKVKVTLWPAESLCQA